MIEVTKDILKKVYPKREPWARKYDFGNLLIIGGSKLYSGSPAFNALAALRSGVDLVTILAPERAANIIASFSPVLIVYPLKGDYLGRMHLKELLDFSKYKTAVIIGGGLTRREETFRTVNEFLEKVNVPCVIDADAIHAVAKNKEVIKRNFVLTPHSYEFSVLSDIKVTSNVEERTDAVKETASELKATILLKGHVDIISDGKEVALNRTGNPYMTKGGFGDTLTGVCGTLLARKIDPFTAACAAAYINGKAGDMVAKELKEGVLPTDLIRAIPKVIKG